MSFKAKLSLFFLIILIVSAVFIIFLPLNPNSFNPDNITQPLAPSWQHIFGTDDLGRDVFLRVIYGARISLLVGFIAVSFSVFIGVLVGVISGFLGGIWDEIIMRATELVMAIPSLFLILIIQSFFQPSIFNVIVVIGLTSWMGMARLVRAEVLSVKERLFITAARARGIAEPIILFKHVLPHTLTPVIVNAILGIGSAILIESVLSFLGLGVQPPNASWGNMLENSMNFMFVAPWLAIVPGLFITLTVLAINFLADDLRNIMV